MFARLAIEADAPALIDMAADAVLTHYGDVADRGMLREAFDRYLEFADPTVFVCEANRTVAGFAAFQICAYTHKSGIYTSQRALCVSPGYRGSRAAVLLMREFVCWSTGIGALEIHGGTSVNFRTKKMASFLKRFGFQECGIVAKRNLGLGRRQERV